MKEIDPQIKFLEAPKDFAHLKGRSALFPGQRPAVWENRLLSGSAANHVASVPDDLERSS